MSSDVPVRKAEFTPAIERQALRIVMKDPMFVIKWRNRLKPEHFNEPHIQVMFKALDSYVETYNTLPTIESFYQHLKEHIGSYENVQGFYDFASILFAEKDTQVEAHVKDLLMEHMKAVDFDRFAVETARLAGDKEYDKIPKLLHEITIRHTLSVPVSAYLSTPEDSVASRVAAELAQKASLATPWVTFNNKHGGGFHPSAVAAFMGPTGSGKSILLVNAGAHYVLNGKNVYHFTFELSAPKTKARYDVCLTGASHAERKANPSLIDSTMAQLKPRMGKLYVIQISTGTCSANAVRAAINDYVLLGAPKPDVIILDYLTIMMPNNPDDVDMKRDYAKLKTIAEEVRAMAMDLDTPVLTALQSTRGSAGKEKISKEDIADSYAVMHVLDCVLSINQSDAEKQVAKMRLYAAKVRDFEDGYSIVMDIKYDCLRIAEDAITTSNYNKAASKIVEDAMAKKVVAGVHAPLPAVAEMGLEQVVGMGANPVKTRNNASVETTQADAAKAASWGVGHQPPPIATPG
jgi:replicative DNA helicase